MSPVSSSTLTCASARWRQHRAGRRRTSGSGVGGAAESVPVVSDASTGGRRRLGVGRRRRRASARRRRGPATASPRGRGAGSPCAAGGPRTPTGGRGGAARDGRRTRRRTSPSTRARASRRPGTPAPTTRRAGASSSTSALSVTPQCAAASTATCANTWKRPVGAGGAEGHLLSAAPAPTCRREPSSPLASAPAASRSPEMNER